MHHPKWNTFTPLTKYFQSMSKEWGLPCVKVVVHKTYTKVQKIKTLQILTKLSGMTDHYLLHLQKKFQTKNRKTFWDMTAEKISVFFVKVVSDFSKCQSSCTKNKKGGFCHIVLNQTQNRFECMTVRKGFLWKDFSKAFQSFSKTF